MIQACSSTLKHIYWMEVTQLLKNHDYGESIQQGGCLGHNSKRKAKLSLYFNGVLILALWALMRSFIQQIFCWSPPMHRHFSRTGNIAVNKIDNSLPCGAMLRVERQTNVSQEKYSLCYVVIRDKKEDRAEGRRWSPGDCSFCMQDAQGQPSWGGDHWTEENEETGHGVHGNVVRQRGQPVEEHQGGRVPVIL